MKDIKKQLLRQFWSESQSDMVLNAEKDAAFNVSLGKLTVGTLLYSGGVWQFSYSDEFKQQSRIVPLSNFPAKDKRTETVNFGRFLHRAYPVLRSCN